MSNHKICAQRFSDKDEQKVQGSVQVEEKNIKFHRKIFNNIFNIMNKLI